MLAKCQWSPLGQSVFLSLINNRFDCDIINPFTARVFTGVLYGDSSFWVCGRNSMMWPFKWKLSACTFTGCYCFSQFWKMKFGNLVETCLWPHLAVKGLINYIRWSSRLKLPFSEQTLLIMSLWRIGRFCFQMFQQPFVGNKPKAIGLVHLPGKKTHLRTRRNNMKMQVLNRIKWRPVIAT